MSGIVVDIGTGDGKFVYELAKANPDKLVIGIDPNAKNLEKTSRKASKKPKKGGLSNALFVLASIEDLPAELAGKANQVFINLPWGSLLDGIIRADQTTWQNLKRICKNGARIDILLAEDPAVDLDHIKRTLPTQLHSLGFRAAQIQTLTQRDLKSYPSSWTKRLAFGKSKKFLLIRVQAQ